MRNVIEMSNPMCTSNDSENKTCVALPSEGQVDARTLTFPVTGQDVRTIVLEKKVWFVARDVAECVGFSLPQKAIIDHCKHAKIYKGSNLEHLTTSPRGINIIPESDVYRLVMRSKLPTAEAFQDWVFEEVLPALRQHGGYMISQPEESPEDIMARALIIAQNTISQQKQVIAVAKPIVAARNRITQGATLWPFREAMRELNVTMREIHNVCHTHGVLKREKIENLYRHWPTRKALNMGIIEKTRKSTGGMSYAFTAKGLQWLKEKLFLV